jgi:hypothetical protein
MHILTIIALALALALTGFIGTLAPYPWQMAEEPNAWNLLKAVQEQQAEIAALKAINDKLRRENDALKAQSGLPVTVNPRQMA